MQNKDLEWEMHGRFLILTRHGLDIIDIQCEFEERREEEDEQEDEKVNYNACDIFYFRWNAEWIIIANSPKNTIVAQLWAEDIALNLNEKALVFTGKALGNYRIFRYEV